MDYVIRNEQEADWRAVEELTRISFWNVNVPGANEHYLAHILRTHPDFIRELDFVMEKDNRIIANIMYTKSELTDDDGNKKQIITFGPVCVHPDFQRHGYGKALMEHSFARAKELGYDTIVIFGHPGNYVSSGFVSCKKHNICIGIPGSFPAAMLVKELIPGCLDGRRYRFNESSAYEFTDDDADAFDRTFPPLKKEYRPRQEEFWIYCRSAIRGGEEQKALVHIIEEHTDVLFKNIRSQIEQSDLDAMLDGIPSSRYLFHTIHSLDQWFINPDDYVFPGIDIAGADEHFSIIDEKRPGFERAESLRITKEQLLRYLEYVQKKTNAYLASLDDQMLCQPVSSSGQYTRLGLILAQFRHSMFHAGMSETLAFSKNGTWPEYTGYAWIPCNTQQ